ncbi:MAG: choice-of-anchor D domain-containing protein [Candidatus Kapabacteria bacterium]|nr:choice-of-anchor D domain-containing protein [Candidatus Kapabacteria bacterium]
MPDGEQILAINTISSQTAVVRLAATRSIVYSSVFSSANGWSPGNVLYQVNPLRRIVDASTVASETGASRRYALLLDDGTVLFFTYSFSADAMSGAPQSIVPAVQATNQTPYRKLLIGDSTVVFVGSSVYRYQPSSTTWRLDTIGLNRATVNDIINVQGVITAATNRGVSLFNSSTLRWSRMPGFDSAANCTALHLARNGRWFVGTVNRGTLLSSDNGTSWSVDTAGNNAVSMVRFYDDNVNTIYAVSNLGGNTSALYRKIDGTSTWERIDTILRNTVGIAQRINDLAGEQTLEVASTFGIYSTQSGGNTWAASIAGIQAEDIYGFQFLSGGMMVSTGLGIFKKQGSGAWSKVYPQTGFLAGRPLYKYGLASPVIVTQLAAVTSGNVTSQGAILVSSDAGATWTADTTGLYIVPGSSGFGAAPVLTVDNGGRYSFMASASVGQTPLPLRIFTNTPPWSIDTTGLGLRAAGGQQFQQAYGVYANDRRTTQFAFGAVYTGQNVSDNLVYTRPYSGGAWTLDSMGLSKNPLIVMTSRDTSVYAGSQLVNGAASLFKRSGSSWMKLPAPPAAVSDTRAIALDSTGVLYVCYGPVVSTGSPNRGVYATTNEGTAWEYAGLDSVTVRGLTGASDGMYAYTNRGTYKLTRQVLRAAVILLNNRTINFDSVGIGQPRDSVVQITNTGNDTLRVTNFRAASNAVFTATPTQFVLAPGQSRDVTIRFLPTTAGAFTAVIRTTSNTQPDSIRVSGFGKPSNAIIQVANRVIAFGLVNLQTSKDTLIPIKNIGTDTLIVTNIQSNNNAFTPTPSSFRVAPNEETMLRIRFTPPNVMQANGRLRIISNAAADSLLVNGQGQQPESVEETMLNELNAVAYPQPSSLTNAKVRFTVLAPCDVQCMLVSSTGETIIPELSQWFDAGIQTFSIASRTQGSVASGVYYLRIRSPFGTSIVPVVIEE